PEPETSLRFLVAWVPARWAARYCFTASHSRSSFTAPKTSSASSSVPTFFPLRSQMSMLAMLLCLLRRPLRCLQGIDGGCTSKSTALPRRLLGLGDYKITAIRPRHAALYHH